MRGNIIKNSVMWFAFKQIARINLHCKLVPVQYREYETDLIFLRVQNVKVLIQSFHS